MVELLLFRCYFGLFVRVKNQRSGIEAIAQPGRFWAVIENVAEMSVATGAKDFDAAHAVTAVFDVRNVFFGEWLEEAGPAGAGIEFGVGGKEGQAAADAGINPRLFMVVEDAAEGAFGPFSARDLVLLLGQLAPPCFIALDDFLDSFEFGGLAILAEEADLDRSEVGFHRAFYRVCLRSINLHRTEPQREEEKGQCSHSRINDGF